MAVEGRVNAVRVPADVFLNGSQYSYVVPSATFSHVRAASLSVTRALGTITVGPRRLATSVPGYANVLGNYFKCCCCYHS